MTPREAIDALQDYSKSLETHIEALTTEYEKACCERDNLARKVQALEAMLVDTVANKNMLTAIFAALFAVAVVSRWFGA